MSKPPRAKSENPYDPNTITRSLAIRPADVRVDPDTLSSSLAIRPEDVRAHVEAERAKRRPFDLADHSTWCVLRSHDEATTCDCDLFEKEGRPR